MKRKVVDKLFYDQTKRKRRIILVSSIIAIVSLLAVVSIYFFINTNKVKYITYSENSKVNYNVYLKENDFFEEKFLPANKIYISSLIDYVDAEFKYNLNVMDSDVHYTYSYRIESNVTVKEKNGKKVLYNYVEDLMKEDNISSDKLSKINLNKNIKIDYNKYNRLISRFINVYSLSNTVSTLDVSMYVKVKGICEDNNSPGSDSVITLSIPLTTDTIDIAMKYDIIDNNEIKSIKCVDDNEKNYLFLFISIILIIGDSFTGYKLFRYANRTRTPESVYEKELKKILFNYKSYIQKINNNIELKGYSLYKVDTFTDMLEIRDTINEPILMVENKVKDGVFFIIPTSTKRVYVYSLKVDEIRKQLESELESN